MTPSDQEKIGDLIELACTYLADGAFSTAADRLRKAADHCERVAYCRERDLCAIIDGATGCEFHPDYVRQPDYAALSEAEVDPRQIAEAFYEFSAAKLAAHKATTP